MKESLQKGFDSIDTIKAFCHKDAKAFAVQKDGCSIVGSFPSFSGAFYVGNSGATKKGTKYKFCPYCKSKELAICPSCKSIICLPEDEKVNCPKCHKEFFIDQSVICSPSYDLTKVLQERAPKEVTPIEKPIPPKRPEPKPVPSLESASDFFTTKKKEDTKFKVEPFKESESILKFYYSMLSPNDKNIYDQVIIHLRNFEPKFSVKGILNSPDAIFEALNNDNPELFMVDWNFKGISIGRNMDVFGPNVSFDINYCYTKEQYQSLISQIDDYRRKIENKLDSKDLLGSFHNSYVTSLVYNFDDINNFENYSMVGAAINKKAVCEGISEFAFYVLRDLGYNTSVCLAKTKDKGVGHKWNVVKIGKKIFHIDFTGDLSNSLLIRRDFYMVPAKTMESTYQFTFFKTR